MTIGTLLVLGAFIFYVLKNGNHSKAASPSERDLGDIRYYLKDENILPYLEKFDVSGMEWWPSKIEAKDNWFIENVKFSRLEKAENKLEVGEKIHINSYWGYGKKVQIEDHAYNYAFDHSEDGQHTIWKTLSGKLAQAGRENRLEARVRRIDPIDKEIDVVLYSLDKPLPWEHKQAKGFSIPKKSFDKLLNESSTAEELDSKLREWWSKRDARAAKRAAKKAQEQPGQM